MEILKFITSSTALMLAILLTPASQAQPPCAGLLADEPSMQIQPTRALPKVGRRYRVQFVGDPTVRSLKFVGLVESNGKILAEFSEGWGQSKAIYRVSEEEIAEWRNPLVSSAVDQGRTLGRIVMFPLGQAIMARTLSTLMFKPFRQLAKVEEAVEVIGNATSSKALGRKVAHQLKDFDHLMMSMGFERPKLTRVFVGSFPLLPNLTGPFSLSYPTVNIWRGKDATPIVAINPVLWRTQPVKDEGVLYHERMHSLLHRTYSNKAYINRNKAIQEALADFAAAHMTNSPKIGKAIGGEDDPMRDLEQRRSDVDGWQKKRLSPLDVDGESYHDNSMMVSHIFWRLRQTIGSDAINEVLKPILDNLNDYRHSYDDLLKREGKTTKERRQQFIYDLEYVLAVVFKTSRQWSSESEVRSMLQDAADDLNFSIERVQNVSSHLSKADENYRYDSSLEMRQTILAKIYGAAGLVVDASLVFWLTGGL